MARSGSETGTMTVAILSTRVLVLGTTSSLVVGSHIHSDQRTHRNSSRRLRESDSMRWRGPRRGFFEGPPRVLYRRTGPRYIGACAVAIVINGVVVAGFGLVTLALYVDLSAAELGLFAGSSAAGYVLEGLVAAVYLRRAALPVRAWLRGEEGKDAASHAWSAAARLPPELLRRPSLYAIGAVGAGAADLVL